VEVEKPSRVLHFPRVDEIGEIVLWQGGFSFEEKKEKKEKERNVDIGI